MQIDMKRFHAAFFDETAEHLAVMEESLLGLERTPDDQELLNRIFRAAHSIKGASGTFGFGDIATFTHSLEGLLDRMRDGEILPTPNLVELLLQSADALGGLLAWAKDGGEPPKSNEGLIQALELARQGGHAPAPQASAASASPAAAPTAGQEYQVTFHPGRDLLHFGMDPLLLLRDLGRVGEVLEVTADTSKLPDLATLVPDECYLGWKVRLRSSHPVDDVRSIFVFVEDCSQITVDSIAPAATPAPAASSAVSAAPGVETPAPKPRPAEASAGEGTEPQSAQPKAKSLESSSIRVSVEKVDELINLVGELVIAQSMVNQVSVRIPGEVLPLLQESLGIMDRSVRDLQERVMSVRMVPLANVFRRFPRLVRDLASTMGKQISVEIAGEDTELDKQMIEQIVDPLTHMVRNSVDHGIGTPEERRASGKPPEGKLSLRAYQEGGNVVIEVADDGRGLDRQRIRQKAVAQGRLGADDPLTDDQIHELIFAPGFSTADKVTDVSGRGVGMDVVKRNIEALRGSVSIHSVPGQGTTFLIRLPLTMAIVDGLALGLGDQIYIVPLLSVLQSFRPKTADVRRIVGRGEVVMVRNHPVPLVRLHRLFHTGAADVDPSQAIVVLVEHQGKRLGLLVDELVGEMQVVMKSIETNYQKVEGISAATILGDGQVAYILDTAGLSRLARSTTAAP
jgi:two-component system chemotaxis sensor kinase CheA